MKFVNSDLAYIDLNIETPIITFPVLSDIEFVQHGFSTRLGGVSKDMFESMNLGFHCGPYRDEPANVIENFKRVSKSIGINSETIVISKQVHKTNIKLVDQNDCGKGLYRLRDFDEIDGLITNTPNVTLVTKYADCVPIFLVDTKKKAIGLIHSGWRGTVNKIGLIAVEEMQKNFQSNPQNIVAVIGPSICKECFEIGEEVANEFRKAFPFNDGNDILYKKEYDKYECDLWYANQLVLLEAGLLPQNIHISNVCTSCNPDLLFSHRKTQGKRGSLAAFLSIEENI